MPKSRSVRDVLQSRGVQPRKSMGQNFVVDELTIDRIVALAELSRTDQVVEVGPGAGSLTVALAGAASTVTVIEKDETLVPVLHEVLVSRGISNVRIVVADALELDWTTTLGQGPCVLVSNLPYNVSVPVIMSVLERAPAVERMLVMVQQEVAERLAATPGGRTIGVPTIALGWHARATVVGEVAPEVFWPVPNVSSALVDIRRHRPPSQEVDIEDVMRLVVPAYSKRRKMLRSSLPSGVGEGALERAGIDPTSRPEVLSLDDWVRLAEDVHRNR